MIQELQLRILPEEAVCEQSLKQVVARETGISVPYIHTVRVLKRSIDARQRTIYVNVKLRAFINEQPDEPEFQLVEYKDVSAGKPVVVVGAGPGGLFAALRLIELGLRPIVIERGKNVRERKKDIALISREHKVDGESNYSFGEGGAGAYSDGKLYTRSKKRGSVDKILNVFCQFGASTSILADAHPHIGTDKLPRVIENIREQIIRCGGEVHFETRMDALVIRNGEVIGVETNTGENFLGPVILATGHSARDVYRYLHDRQIPIEAKGIAVGVRLEHPQMLIDQIQYHRKEGRGNYLPAAEYSFVAQVGGRGVYSFCMCPGGFVVPAASSSRQVVVNGMSPSNRGSRWANSGMVVDVSITSPFTAGTFEKCLRTGKDPLRGGGFDITNYQLLSGSIGTAADCLYAIQSAVYEKKLVTMEELIKALSVDFEGYEVLRQQLLHLPKYGNDKKEVDALAKQIADHFLARVNAFRGPEDTLLYPGLYNIDFKIFANVTGATPDGRRFRDAIAEHCSPTPGAAKKGPTAILNSASTLPMKEGFASSVLHLTLDKNGYSMGADRIKIIDTLLRASEKKKIPVLSLTMYDKAELLDAQLHPEKHQDLIVRVWGFQARFTELDTELQDHIINRIS